MSERNHGRRYSFEEKKEILDYLERHTYKGTSEKYLISETTLSRWKKALKSGSKKNRSKIIISLPKFWLEYLNEQIEADEWEDYSDAILTIIRFYFRSQQASKHADSKYLESAKEILPSLVNLNPNIESMLLSSFNEVLYKTEQWESTEGILNLIKIWKKVGHKNWINKRKKYAHLRQDWIMQDPEEEMVNTKNIRFFEFQNEIYSIRDISVKHLIAVKRGNRTSYLLGLKRKLTETDVFIFAIAKSSEESSLLLAMDSLKRAAMGSLPPISEESGDESLIMSKDVPSSGLETILQRRKDYIEKAQEIIREDPQIIIKEQATGLNRLNSRIREKYGEDIVENKGFNKNYLKEYVSNWEKEKEKRYKIEVYPVLMRGAKRVNMSLEPGEKKVLEALEKQIGKKIERITADPEQQISRNDLMPIQNGKIVQERSLEKLPWIHAGVDFPAHLFPCHYIASNGKITLLTLLNLGLSEIPTGILNLKNLTYLCLASNNITDLPHAFSNLKALEGLNLNNNQFSDVPNCLIELPRLQNLCMRNNKISKIPVALTDAWHTRLGDPSYQKSWNIPNYLIFSGNPIEINSLSKEQELIVKGTGTFDYSTNSTIQPRIVLVID